MNVAELWYFWVILLAYESSLLVILIHFLALILPSLCCYQVGAGANADANIAQFTPKSENSETERWMSKWVDVFKLCCTDTGQRSELKSVTVKIKLKNNIGEPKRKKNWISAQGHRENSDLQRRSFFFFSGWMSEALWTWQSHPLPLGSSIDSRPFLLCT